MRKSGIALKADRVDAAETEVPGPRGGGLRRPLYRHPSTQTPSCGPGRSRAGRRLSTPAHPTGAEYPADAG